MIHIDIYRDLPLQSATIRYTLTSDIAQRILRACRQRHKGGFRVSNDGRTVLNCRGGRKGVARVCRSGIQVDEGRRAYELSACQERGPHQTNRPGQVLRDAQKHETRRKLNSTTLASVSSRHDNLSRLVPARDYHDRSCYLHPLYPVWQRNATPNNTQQRQTTAYNDVGSTLKGLPMIPICQWCHYTERRPAPFLYGSIPLCGRCYRYATQSDQATRESLNVAYQPRKVRVAA